MDSTLTKVLLDILLVLVNAGVVYLGWYLKKKLGVEKTKDIMSKVKVAVEAAELLGARLGWDGAAKKEYVVNLVSQTFKIPEEQLDAFIESAVLQLKASWEEFFKDETTGAILPSHFSRPIESFIVDDEAE